MYLCKATIMQKPAWHPYMNHVIQNHPEGNTPKGKKKAVPMVTTSGRQKKGGDRMRYQYGFWWYMGNQYTTLHDALVSVWPK